VAWYDVFGAVEAVSELLKPVVSRSIIEKTDKAHAKRLQQWQQEFQKWVDDNPDNDVDAGHFILRILAEANHPSGDISGRTVRVPLDVINSLVIIASENIRAEEIEAQLRDKV